MTAFTAPYRNWKGETSTRRIIPLSVRWDATEWHPEPQWLLVAYDLDKQALREFALRDFHPQNSAIQVRPLEWDHTDSISTAEHAFGSYGVYAHGDYMLGRWTTGTAIGRDFPSREAAIEAIEKSHHAYTLELVA